MKMNSICKILIDEFWVTIPANITIIPHDPTCSFYVNGYFDCNIPVEYFYSEWGERIDAKEKLRNKEG